MSFSQHQDILKLHSGYSLYEGREKSVQIGVEIKGLTLRYKNVRLLKPSVLSVSVRILFGCK